MPRYQEPEAGYALVPDGDYVLCVHAFVVDISTGQRTRKSDRYSIVFAVEGTESKFKEMLFDHPTTAWKVNAFLKACGLRLKDGQDYSFEKDKAAAKGWPWINPMGLRCHAKVVQEAYTGSSGTERFKNKVEMFYTDKPTLTPNPEYRNKPVTRAQPKMTSSPVTPTSAFSNVPDTKGADAADDIPF